jgi:prepilin-type N-terminal cleavage/methylation domain-containing protein
VDVRNHRRGVTLFESVVVMVILVISAAGAMLTFNSFSGNTPLNAAADTIKARWADARARAIADGIPYKFAVMEGTGKFRVAPNSPEFWSGGAGNSTPSGNGSGPQPLVIEDTLTSNIRFCGAQSTDASPANGQPSGQGGGGNGEWSCEIVFTPDGNVLQNAEITFGGQGTKNLTLKVWAATGAVTTSS